MTLGIKLYGDLANDKEERNLYYLDKITSVKTINL